SCHKEAVTPNAPPLQQQTTDQTSRYQQPGAVLPTSRTTATNSGYPPAYDDWYIKYLGDVKQSKEEFVQHFRRKYDGGLPIWMAVELMSLARLSRLYGGLTYSDRERIARRFGISEPGTVASWLHCLTYVRNVCAHHARLWNRNMDRRPAVPPRARIEALTISLLPAPLCTASHGSTRHSWPFVICCDRSNGILTGSSA
ncbi:MAG: Abi family protein, partial [Candidatus Nanopelagicales bacterium]|nr:Abi family protein [Candidatus Nanopelagicales bacterium]